MPGKMCHGFKPGDLVFAKMKGFPHWPARVCKSDDAHKKRVPVFFFGTHQIGHIPQENIVPFSGNKLKYGSGVRIKGFTEGMWEIQNTPGVGSKSKITAKAMSKNTLAKSAAASKTTSAARSTPSKRTFTSRTSTKATSSGRTSRANLNVDAKSTAVKPECDVETSPSEATSKIESLPAASTVELMACAAECVPAQMSLRISTSKNHQEATLSKAEDVPRRSSSRSAAQTPTHDLPQEASSPKGAASAEGRRRGRSRKPSKEKIVVEQGADNQTSGVPMSEGHDASMEDLNSCMVKCKKSRSSSGPATRLTDTANEPVSTLIKRAGRTKLPRKSWSPSTAQLPAEVIHIPQKTSKPNDGAAAVGRRRGRSKAFVVEKSQNTDVPLISQIDPLCETHNHISQTATTLTPSSICIDAQEETEQEQKNKQLHKMPVEEQAMDLREKTWPEKEKQQMQEAEESTDRRGANRKKTKEPLEEEKKQLVEMPEENQQLEEKSKMITEEPITEKEVERRRNEDEEMEKKKALEEESKQPDKMPEEEQKEIEESTQLGEENQKKLVKESPMSSLVKRFTQEEEEEKQPDKLPDEEQRETQEKMQIGEEKQNYLEEESLMSSVVKRLTQEEDQPNKMPDEEQRETQEKMRIGGKKQKELEKESPVRSLVKSNTQEQEEKKKPPGKIPGEEQEKMWQGEENQKELEEKSPMSTKTKKKIEEQQKDLIEKIQPGEEKQLLENAEELTGKRGAKRKRKKEEIESGEEKIPQGEANRRLEEKMVPEEKSITRRGAERKKNEDKETEKKKTSEGERNQPEKIPEEKTQLLEEKQNTLEEESSMSKGVKKKTDEKQKNQLEEKHKDLETKSTTSKGVKRKRKEEERKQGEEEQKKQGEESTVSKGAEGKRKDKTKDLQEPKKQVQEEQKVLAEDSTRRRVERKRKEEIQQEGSLVAKAEEAITAEKQSRRKSEEGGSKKRRKEQEAAEEKKKRRKEKATEDRREARRKSRKDKDTRERGRTTDAEKDGAKKGHVDEEQRLAAKRESLLKSLRGLIKESSPKSITKSRTKTTARSHKMLKESSMRKKGLKVRGSQPLVKEAKKNQEATQSKKSATQSDDSKVKEKTQADEKKLIGKIVKATTKVQVKTMLGGATLQEEQRKKMLKADDTKLQRSSKESRKPERLTTNDKSARNGGGDQEGKSKLRDDAKNNLEEIKKGDKMATSEKDGNAASKLAKQHSGGRSHKQTTHVAMQSGVSSGDAAEDSQQQKNNSNLTLIDSTLHRIHGDIRISLKGDNPDVSKCLAALDQLSGIYVTSQHVQRHSELVSTLRKMRFYRANLDIMDKAAMLYNRFKNAFLLGEDQEVVSATFLRSLLEEKEREKAVCCDEGAGLEQKPVGGEEEEVQKKETLSVD
ncbi:trichohyalin-like isoform X2 [Nerophis ophidion]|uniref:trichohyalin-like isoform X2 n=1 Tax=Nerophis ophidion TaxID=159077 RepID=UPI002AE09747|nr:trichohyalin-like isoform X2 [Nerophis ophidion]